MIKYKDNSFRCPWCGEYVKPALPYHSYADYDFMRKAMQCEFCKKHYREKSILEHSGNQLKLYFVSRNFLCKDSGLTPMMRCFDTIMPERGYRVLIILKKDTNVFQFSEDTIIPAIFIDDENKPVSGFFCVRVRNILSVKKTAERNVKIICDIKIISGGKQPRNETERILFYNLGKIIGKGKIIQQLDYSYE